MHAAAFALPGGGNPMPDPISTKEQLAFLRWLAETYDFDRT